MFACALEMGGAGQSFSFQNINLKLWFSAKVDFVPISPGDFGNIWKHLLVVITRKGVATAI